MTDCSDYSDKKCLKGVTIKHIIKENILNVCMVGCWGVYCWDGEIDNFKYTPPELNNKMEKGFIEYKKNEYGSKRVVEGLYRYSKNFITDSIFLAGDNVYNYNLPKEKLLELISSEKYRNSVITRFYRVF